MPKKARELGPLAVSRLAEPGMHFVGGVSGLALQVLPTGGRTWVLRATIGNKRRDMGLGGYPDVTLAGAREAARAAREKIRAGIDPIEEGRTARSMLKAAQAAALTFEQCAAGYIESQEAGWKNAKHAQQWTNTLAAYAGCVGLLADELTDDELKERRKHAPVLGSLLVRDIDTPQVLDVLRPIWTTKTETASRVRGRVELVLDWATTSGYRKGLNPARWKGHLDNLLPKPSKVAKVEHHAALPIDDMGEFMQKLRKMEGMGARALEFAILTAARSGEVRGATWSEIDLDSGMWKVPAERMKAGREHRVPLSNAAMKLLQAMPQGADTNFVFASSRGGPLSDMTLTAVLRRMEVDAVPHGFRSTFRDWAAERTSYPHEMAEMALAHTIGDKAEAAYRRGDMFEKRRKMMDAWASFIAQPQTKADVIPMKKARAAAPKEYHRAGR